MDGYSKNKNEKGEIPLMAISTCVKCANTQFEIKEAEPRGSSFKLMFVQCTSCGGVVGVTDFLNIGAKLEFIQKKLGIS